MNKPIEDVGRQPQAELDEAQRRLGTAGRTVHAQRGAEIAKRLDRLIDDMQQLAAEIDDGRAFAVIHVADKLTRAQDALRRTVFLLGVAP